MQVFMQLSPFANNKNVFFFFLFSLRAKNFASTLEHGCPWRLLRSLGKGTPTPILKCCGTSESSAADWQPQPLQPGKPGTIHCLNITWSHPNQSSSQGGIEARIHNPGHVSDDLAGYASTFRISRRKGGFLQDFAGPLSYEKGYYFQSTSATDRKRAVLFTRV